jgi:hypothetical protein
MPAFLRDIYMDSFDFVYNPHLDLYMIVMILDVDGA